MYCETISNHAENTPCTASAVFGGMVALLVILALVAAFLAVWACSLWLPLWAVWAAGAVALAECFVIGWRSL